MKFNQSSIFFLLIGALLFSVVSFVSAHEDATTPYGDYCKHCTRYGTCSAVISPQDAVAEIEKYYTEKGYSVGRVEHKGRFVETEIFKDNKLIDKVLFDRKTGRLRSTY